MTGHDGTQARLTIDLDALKSNWRLLAARAPSAECGAVVKADAYGLGIEQAVPALARAGCRTFFVAHLGEGVRARTALRAAGRTDAEARIFLLHGLPGLVIHPDAIDHGLAPILGSVTELEVWGAAPKTLAPAIQVDTGMNRIGIAPEVAAKLTRDVVTGLRAAFVMSHFVAAEEPDNPVNGHQIDAFEDLRDRIFPDLPASLANSSGIFLPQSPHYDLVRPGYALYGGNPCPGRVNPMRPVIALEAAILETRSIAAGERVGYNGRWTARRPTRLATIGIGYADGVPRSARTVGENDGPVARVGGVPCRLVGRVSMDLSIVDITDVPEADATLGAPVELIGPDNTVDAFGAQCGTIGYEILTGLGRRYGRTYLETMA